MREHHLCQPPELPVQGYGAGQSADGQARCARTTSSGSALDAGQSGGLSQRRKRGLTPCFAEQRRRTSPAASASALPSPGRCCTTVRCTSSTRPRRTSTWRARTTSWPQIHALAGRKTVHPDFPPPGKRHERRTNIYVLERGISVADSGTPRRAAERRAALYSRAVDQPSRSWNTTERRRAA